MKKTVIIVLVLLLSLFIACSVDAPSRPERESDIAAATASLPSLLPASTVAAVELRDLTRRWTEVRSLRPIAALQDRLLATVGLTPSDLVTLAGTDAVVALVAHDRAVIPVALLRPRQAAAADSALALLEASLTVVRADGAIWIGPPARGDEIESLSRREGRTFTQAFAFDEAESRLPPGGLIRGFVNPAALAALLRAQIPEPWATALDLFRSMLAAELDAVRWIGFRRDVESNHIVTDAMVAYDKGMLPPEVAAVFNPGASPPSMPVGLMDDVVAAVSFRTEASASLPWLHYVAGRDRRGPMRNLDFWIREFEERSGRSVRHDLLETIGDYGWLLSFEDATAPRLPWIVVLQSRDPGRAEATLLSLCEWSADRAWVRTLGLAVPRIRHYAMGRDSVHVLLVRTPAGELEGPAFGRTEGYLLIGAGTRAIEAGRALAMAGAFTTTVPGLSPKATQAVLSMRTHAIAGLAASIENWTGAPLAPVAHEFLSGVADVEASVAYVDDGVRLHGVVELR